MPKSIFHAGIDGPKMVSLHNCRHHCDIHLCNMIPIGETQCRRDYSAPISDRAIIAEIDFHFQLWFLALHVGQIQARWDEIPGQDLVLEPCLPDY